MCLISIVIPLYNGKNYIEKIVSSLNGISFSKEILIVDDGSTDGSYDFCISKYKDRNEIKIIKKTNTGISNSRNWGVRDAKGKYIMFADQDDYIDSAVINKAIKVMMRRKLNAVFWSTAHDEKGSITPCDIVYHDKVADKDMIRKDIIPALLYRKPSRYMSYMGHIWAGLFCINLIRENEIYFKYFIDYEDDQLFIFDYLFQVERIGFIKDIGYFWVTNIHSHSHRDIQLDRCLDRHEKYFAYLYEKYKTVINNEEELYNFKNFGYQMTICDSIRNASMGKYIRKTDIDEIRNALKKIEYRKGIDENFRNINNVKYKIYLYLLRNDLLWPSIWLSKIYFILKHSKERFK